MVRLSGAGPREALSVAFSYDLPDPHSILQVQGTARAFFDKRGASTQITSRHTRRIMRTPEDRKIWAR